MPRITDNHPECNVLHTTDPTEQFMSANPPAIASWWEVARAAAIIWLLVVGLWSGPSLGATLVYPNGLLWVEGALVVVLLVLARQGVVRSLRDYPLGWACLGVLALAALAATIRAARGDGFDALCLWQHSEPMLRGLLLYLAIAGQPRWGRLAWGSALTGMALLALVTVVQHLLGLTRWYAGLDRGWADGIASVHGWRAQGLTSYINLTAALLAAAVPCWIIPPLLRMPPARITRILLLLGGLLTTAGVWYTRSRAAFLVAGLVSCLFCWRVSFRWGIGALAVVGVFVIVVYPAVPVWALSALLAALVLGRMALEPRRRYLLAIALSLGLAGGLQALDAYVLHFPLTFRLTEEGVTDVARLELYRNALTLVRTAPWWGVGDAGVSDSLNRLANPALRRLPRTQRNAHNQYLHWAAAEGIPVALAFTALVIAATAWCWRRARRRRAPFPRAVGLAIAVSLATFLLANLTDAHFWRIEGAGFFWSLFAVAAAIDE